MNKKIYYQDQCPSCGRPLQVGVVNFGREVSCTTCHKSFCSVGSGSETEAELNQRIDSLIGPEESRQEAASILLAGCSE